MIDSYILCSAYVSLMGKSEIPILLAAMLSLHFNSEKRPGTGVHKSKYSGTRQWENFRNREKIAVKIAVVGSCRKKLLKTVSKLLKAILKFLKAVF